jgi:hypothetical protein
MCQRAGIVTLKAGPRNEQQERTALLKSGAIESEC